MIAILPEVKKFLQTSPVKMFIGGKWTAAANGETFAVRDPGDGSVIAQAPDGGAVDVDRAVRAARKAFVQSGWAELPANDRAVLLHRLADLIDKHRGIIAQIESLDVGKPIPAAAGFDIPHAAHTTRARCGFPTAFAHSFFRGISRSCWSAGVWRRRWRPATRW
jgi:aldehyde dehydrogenase (NAD+)